MRLLPLSLPVLVSLPVLGILLLSAACGNTAANNGNNNAGTGDTLVTGDAALDTANADTAGTDAAVNDTESKDVLQGTDAVADEQIGTDAVADEQIGTDAEDTIDVALDVTQDTGKPTLAPGACVTDKDCLGLNFAPCMIGYCDASNKMCKIKAAADGTACSTTGSCGGPGLCNNGSCNAPSTCKPDVCSPQALACGDKIVVDLSSLGTTSAFSGYGDCSSSKWIGPEVEVLLTSDVTMTATLSVDVSDVTIDYQLFDIAPTLDGKCDTAACDDWGYSSLTVGLPGGMPRIIFLDTSATGTGIITLSVDCTAATYCGNGACDSGETCGGCPSDCGKCASAVCGDNICDANEDCAICPGDCGGKCDSGCETMTTPTCGGCSCEVSVCAGDAYCCEASGKWDDFCVNECVAAGGKCPTVITTCGDGTCDSAETTDNCPNDCWSGSKGDGICAPTESCKAESIDCGFCLMAGLATSGCGDGKCTGDETCLTCAADCGKCGDYSCACLDDPTCCTEGFGWSCQDSCNACVANNGGGSCPINNCGDGVCSGETCLSCSEDCGECPAYCGDGNCDTASGETLATCPSDCTDGCGKSSSPTCNGCSCEACVCAMDPYCCEYAWDSKCIGECSGKCGMKCP
jgi:hypothetical protein